MTSAGHAAFPSDPHPAGVRGAGLCLARAWAPRRTAGAVWRGGMGPLAAVSGPAVAARSRAPGRASRRTWQSNDQRTRRPRAITAGGRQRLGRCGHRYSRSPSSSLALSPLRAAGSACVPVDPGPLSPMGRVKSGRFATQPTPCQRTATEPSHPLRHVRVGLAFGEYLSRTGHFAGYPIWLRSSVRSRGTRAGLRARRSPAVIGWCSMTAVTASAGSWRPKYSLAYSR
jgi:hypothetical protein